MSYVQGRAAAGSPLILSPQTIGPFNTAAGRVLAKRTLRSASAVLTRDPVSLKYATDLGVAAPMLSTDVVFALRDVNVAALPVPSTDVLLNVSGLLWQGNTHVDARLYQSNVRSFIRQTLKSGKSLSLLAHVVDNPTPDNDLIAIEPLSAEFRSDVDVHVPNDLWEARATIADAGVVVSTRMHASLSAISMGIPAVPWAYSRKFAPLLGALGWNDSIELGSLTADSVANNTIERVSRILEDPASARATLTGVRNEAQERLKVARVAITQALSNASSPRQF
jgi:polysaccharide pyruvyl transferase WcaK-like protein